MPIATATVTSVNDSATSVTILAANTNRKGASIFNNSSSTLYLRMGTGDASPTDFSIQMDAGALYELPASEPFHGCYLGSITGIWSANSTGAALVTEYV